MGGMSGVGRMDGAGTGGLMHTEGTNRQDPKGFHDFNRTTEGVPKTQGSDDSMEAEVKKLIKELKQMEASQDASDPSDDDQDPMTMARKHGKHHGMGKEGGGVEAASAGMKAGQG